MAEPYLSHSEFRCHRLGKDCQPSVSIRRRNVEKGASNNSVRQEEKVDDFVSILRPQAVKKQPQSTGAGTSSQFSSSDLNHLSPASSAGPPGYYHWLCTPSEIWAGFISSKCSNAVTNGWLCVFVRHAGCHGAGAA